MSQTIKQFAAALKESKNEAFRRRNPNAFLVMEPKTDFVTGGLAVAINSDEAKLNKTERAYLAFIRCIGFAWIGVQNVTLKLGNDCRYTPDFFVINQQGHAQAREVKGFMRDDALVKLKVAARLFPWIEFQVVRKTKNGWEHQTVKP